MTALAEIRSRASERVNTVMAAHDRRHLLSLVERMRPYVRHVKCSAQQDHYACTCGLDALLEELK